MPSKIECYTEYELLTPRPLIYSTTIDAQLAPQGAVPRNLSPRNVQVVGEPIH
jgi:hypothetical protein